MQNFTRYISFIWRLKLFFMKFLSPKCQLYVVIYFIFFLFQVNLMIKKHKFLNNFSFWFVINLQKNLEKAPAKRHLHSILNLR